MGQGEEGLGSRALGRLAPHPAHMGGGAQADLLGSVWTYSTCSRGDLCVCHPLWGPGGFHRQKVPPPHIQRPITDQHLSE